MPTTTKWALPYPAPADPADVPADIQRLANGVDGLSLLELLAGGATRRKVAWGTVSGMSSGGAAINLPVTHGLGVVPVVVMATVQKHPSGLYAITAMIDVVTSTGFTVIGIPNATISPNANATSYWLAIG